MLRVKYKIKEGNKVEYEYIESSANSAKTYSSSNSPQTLQALQFIAGNKQYITGDVLDAGCGTGEISNHMAWTFPCEITGLDISKQRIDYAKEHYASKRLRFVEGNAAELDLNPQIKEKTFDTIVSFNTIHHMESSLQLDFFKQVMKALKPNGMALILVPGRSPELHDAINATATSPRWKNYFADFDLAKVRTYETPEYYQNLCMQAGFYSCEVTSAREKSGAKLDQKGMQNFLRGWLPHLAHLRTKGIEPKLYARIEDSFLLDIVNLYFKTMKIKPGGTVEPVITQNRIIACAGNGALFFTHKKSAKKEHKTPTPSKEVVPSCAPVMRLPSKL